MEGATRSAGGVWRVNKATVTTNCSLYLKIPFMVVQHVLTPDNNYKSTFDLNSCTLYHCLAHLERQSSSVSTCSVFSQCTPARLFVQLITGGKGLLGDDI